MTNPSLSTSVALATYNGARFLPAQLASIAAQERRPDEIVVGDDQSSDGTAELLARFERDAGIPVRFTRNQQRLGSSANFGAILGRCRGEVIFLSDQDDLWRADRISTSLRALAGRPDVGFVFSNASLISETGAPLPGTLWERVFFGAREREQFRRGHGADVLLKTNTVTGATMAVRRRALDCALPISAGWVHDGWLAFVIERVHGALPIDEPLVSYRLHQSQQVGVVGWSPREVLGLLRRQDVPYYLSEAANYRVLADHLLALGPQHAAAAAGARGKAEFLEARASVRQSLAGCARSVGRSLVRRSYSRYGLGAKQVVFDVAGGLDAAFRRIGQRSRAG